jgi:hypothetical protein
LIKFEVSLPCSQKLITGLGPEPAEFYPHAHTLFLEKKFSHIRLGLTSGFLCFLFSVPIASTRSKILSCIFLLLRCHPQTRIAVLLFLILSCLVQCTNFSVTRSLPSPLVVVTSVKQVTFTQQPNLTSLELHSLHCITYVVWRHSLVLHKHAQYFFQNLLFLLVLTGNKNKHKWSTRTFHVRYFLIFSALNFRLWKIQTHMLAAVVRVCDKYVTLTENSFKSFLFAIPQSLRKRIRDNASCRHCRITLALFCSCLRKCIVGIRSTTVLSFVCCL